ncbi:MAG: YncE family protein [Myxococcales bacterium]|nr:YncE family protein [Myxococcales bacterium]
MKKALLIALLAIAAGVAAWRLLLCKGAPAAAPAEPQPVSETARVIREGLSIDLELRPLSGRRAREMGEATVSFKVTDASSGEPVRGLRPMGWLWRREGNAAPDEQECRRKMKTFLGGFLSAQAEVDLNSFLLLALNHDNTISIINPQIAFSRTKLLGLVTLSGRAADWAQDGDRLYVTIPARGTLSVVDLPRVRVAANVEVGREASRVLLSPDGRTAFVGADGEGAVALVDTQALGRVALLPTAEGRQHFSLSGDGRWLWAASSGGERVQLFDVERREAAAEVKVGTGASAIASSDSAGAVYLARPEAGELVMVSAARRQLAKRLRLEPGVSGVWFEPGGRWAFASNPKDGSVSVIDSAVGERAFRLEGFQSPDFISFSAAFAYVRLAKSGEMALIGLAELEKGLAPPVFRVALAQKAPSLAKGVGLSSPFARTWAASEMVVAAPADQTLYYYREGMMAPVGSFLNYGRDPLAALVLDRSLREREPGVYRTTVRLPESGLHEVGLLIDKPRVATCLELRVAAAEPKAAPVARVELTPLFDPSVPLAENAPASLRFRMVEATSRRALRPSEVAVLVFRPPGTWQWRPAPRALEDGSLEIEFPAPGKGQLRLLLAAPSLGAPFGSLPLLKLAVGGGKAEAR